MNDDNRLKPGATFDEFAEIQSFSEAFAQACDQAFAEGKDEIECAPTRRSSQLPPAP